MHERRGRARLTDHASPARRLVALAARTQHLQRDVTIEQRIVCGEDVAHSARAQQRLELEAPDLRPPSALRTRQRRVHGARRGIVTVVAHCAACYQSWRW